jgi:hypothetical protein
MLLRTRPRFQPAQRRLHVDRPSLARFTGGMVRMVARLGPTRFQVIEVFRQAEQKDAPAAQMGIPLVRCTTEIFAPTLTVRHQAT